jgi:hypothetical protein
MSDKLTQKLDKYFFAGYSRETEGYYFYNKAEGKVIVAHNGAFMEKEFLYKGVSGIKVQLEVIQETPENVSAHTDPIQQVQNVEPPGVEAPAPHRSIRARRTTEKFTLLTTEQCDILLLDNDEPMTYTEGMMRLDYEKWQASHSHQDHSCMYLIPMDLMCASCFGCGRGFINGSATFGPCAPCKPSHYLDQ